jgi:DNA-binding MarR family transcriptional regulator
MFYDQLAAAIENAGRNQLDDLSRQVSRALGAGSLADDRAQQLYELIHRRRGAQPGTRSLATATPAVPPKRYFIQRSREQRSPDRQASITRRRTLAASGSMPPHLASGYTFCEQAIAHILADEFLAHGVVDLSRNEFGARAGCSQATAKRTLLKFEDDGLIEVERRPRSGRKHSTNLARIKNRDWLTWLARGNRKAAAVRSCAKAKPDFKPFRGVKESPPRSQVLRNSRSDRVDNSVKKGKSDRRWSRRALF